MLFLIWASYFLGQALHMYGRARLVVSSPQNAKVSTYRCYFRAYWFELTFRLVVATALFVLVDRGAGAALGFNLPIDLGDMWIRAALALLVGVGADGLLDKVTALSVFDWLRRDVPPAPGA